MVWFLRRQPGEIKALIVIKNDAPTHHFTNSGQPGATVTNLTDTDPQTSSNPAFITGCHSANH